MTQTAYFRRKVTDASLNELYSNVVRIEIVSVKRENRTYVREHSFLKANATSSYPHLLAALDNVSIGDKLESTTYGDGLGRAVQSVSRETAPPVGGAGSQWGDQVQFSFYDAYGRQTREYLPYASTTTIGKKKETAQIEN